MKQFWNGKKMHRAVCLATIVMIGFSRLVTRAILVGEPDYVFFKTLSKQAKPSPRVVKLTTSRLGKAGNRGILADRDFDSMGVNTA